MSEALILNSFNPQYDEKLFIEFPEKMQVQNMLCTNIVLNVKKTNKKNNFCAQLVLNLYFSENSITNLLSYCGLTDARVRASDTELPVYILATQKSEIRLEHMDQPDP